MFMTKSFVPRRTFLKGFGAAMALPFLDAMVPALTAQAGNAVRRRFGSVFVPHGMRMDHWKPAAGGASFELTDLLQ